MKARAVAAFACGLVFSLGLGLSGMTHPQRILGFLDVFGRWDPTLLFTMAGALAVHLPLLRLILRRRAPVLGTTFHLPTKRKIDARLLFGCALFGMGWAVGGFCPGPAIVSVFGGKPDNLLFFLFLLLGMAAQSTLERRRAPILAAAETATETRS